MLNEFSTLEKKKNFWHEICRRQNGASNDKWNAIDLCLEQISFDFYNFFLELSRKTENCAIDAFWVGFPGRKYRWERKGIPRSIGAK